MFDKSLLGFFFVSVGSNLHSTCLIFTNVVDYLVLLRLGEHPLHEFDV